MAKNKNLHKTIGLRNIFALLAIFSLMTFSSTLFFSQEQPAQAYPAGCVSDACREAADRANAAEQRAADATANAETLSDEVERLNAEIESLEADIVANQAIAADLSEQITQNENKLALQQAALAKLLEKSYREDKDTSDVIVLLAGSESIGDFAEKRARQNTIETQVSTSTKTIKTLKDELEAQKISVDALISSAESKRIEVSEKRNQQNELIAKYEANAEAYAADAAAARETMQREIAAEIARYNSGGTVGSGFNSYPYSGDCPDYTYTAIARGDSKYGGYVCQCTSYAGWKAYEAYGVLISGWGNARYWIGSGGVSKTARGRDGNYHAYRVDHNAAAHTVAVSTSGEFGHVMWVESINSNGTINLTEYNNTASAASHREGDFGARYNVNASAYVYIHFDQPLW